MNHEQLAQRFVDQELSAEERIQFVVALGRDEALRERVLELERLMLGASSQPGRRFRKVLSQTFSDPPSRRRFGRRGAGARASCWSEPELVDRAPLGATGLH